MVRKDKPATIHKVETRKFKRQRMKNEMMTNKIRTQWAQELMKERYENIKQYKQADLIKKKLDQCYKTLEWSAGKSRVRMLAYINRYF